MIDTKEIEKVSKLFGIRKISDSEYLQQKLIYKEWVWVKQE